MPCPFLMLRLFIRQAHTIPPAMKSPTLSPEDMDNRDNWSTTACTDSLTRYGCFRPLLASPFTTGLYYY